MSVGDQTESPIEMAKHFVRNHQPLLAVELLEPWLQEFPEDGGAWSVLAAARYELDNLPDARRAAVRAVELRPQSARNLCNLGMILRKIGDLYEAERVLHRALSVDSSYNRARTELRKIHELRTGHGAGEDDEFL